MESSSFEQEQSASLSPHREDLAEAISLGDDIMFGTISSALSVSDVSGSFFLMPCQLKPTMPMPSPNPHLVTILFYYCHILFISHFVSHTYSHRQRL